MKKGILPTDIADELNKKKVPVRSESVGNAHTRTREEIKRKWTRDSIVRIARDKTYLGYVINEKTKKLSYKSKKIFLTKEEDQIIVADMHEPLIDKETFDVVQQIIDSRLHTRINKNEFLLKGLLECAECGKKLSVLVTTQKSGNKIMYLRCNTYASMTRLKLCTPHSNNCEKLTNKILETIKIRLQQYQKEEELFLLAKDIKDRMAFKKNMIQNQILLLNSKIEQQNHKIDQIYEDRLNEVISVEDFERMYKNLINKKEEYQNSIEELKKHKDDTDKEVDLKKLVDKFISGEEVTREMLVSLIDKITVSEDKEIKIYYKFSLLNEDYKAKDNVIDMKLA